MTGDELSAERIDALRVHLGLPVGPAGPGAEVAVGDLAGDRRAELLAIARRRLRPMAVPVARQLVERLAPAVSERVAERLLGRVEPEVRRLSAEVAVLRAELEALRRGRD
jgi:hypothetical protein